MAQFVTTKSGGEHHYFRQPREPIHFARWQGGEVLGIGRFVVGYSLAPFVERAPLLPKDLLAKLPKVGGNNALRGKASTHMLPSIRGNLSPTQSVTLRSKYLLRKVERAERGNRNAMLHWAACRFGNMIGEGKFKSQTLAEEFLLAAAKANGLLSEDGAACCLATIRSGFEAGIREWGNVPDKREHVCGVPARSVRRVKQRVRA